LFQVTKHTALLITYSKTPQKRLKFKKKDEEPPAKKQKFSAYTKTLAGRQNNAT